MNDDCTCAYGPDHPCGNNGSGSNGGSGCGGGNGGGNGNGNNPHTQEEIQAKKEEKKEAHQAKIDAIKTCVDSGMLKEECIEIQMEEDKHDFNTQGKTDEEIMLETAQIEMIDFKQQLFDECMTTCLISSDKDTCVQQCLGESGSDNKDKAKQTIK